ncbi:23S rRNA (uracil(1939)-C(5))-methyltransferase RlmD [bacterium]|nr:23S rRNA (uracil(1939)-C(5))-methyltransferase RlmD [bacterium]
MESIINNEYKVTCIGINNYAKGITKLDSLLCFVDDLYPGEEAIIKITKEEKNLVYAKVIKYLKRSPHRIDPVCDHEDSGSCPLNNISYEYELELKKQIIRNNLEHTLNINLNDIDIISGDKIKGYRNKVTVFFKKDKDDNLYFGSFKEKTNDLIKINSCVQIDDLFIEIIDRLLLSIKNYNLKICDFNLKKGYIKGVSIRKSEYTNKINLMILSRKDYHKEFDLIAKELSTIYPNISSISVLINESFDTFIYNGNECILFGTGEIEEKLYDVIFRVNNMSFLQVNTSCASKLYKDAISLAHLEENYNVLDLYSGAGGISLNAAKYVSHVFGVEEVYDSVENAKYNAIRNGITNVSFKAADAKDYRSLIGDNNIDVVFIDPPRSGMKREVIDKLLEDEFKTIIYISCDPYTLARDLKLLSSKYEINHVRAFNMFPRTRHVETVCLLTLKNQK